MSSVGRNVITNVVATYCKNMRLVTMIIYLSKCVMYESFGIVAAIENLYATMSSSTVSVTVSVSARLFPPSGGIAKAENDIS